MSAFKRFEDIEAWQKARELTKAIYPCQTTINLPATLACAIRSAGRRSL